MATRAQDSWHRDPAQQAFIDAHTCRLASALPSLDDPDVSRPSQLIRLLLALLVIAAVVFLASSLLSLADTTLSVWQRLEQMPAVLRWLFLLLLAATVAGGAWLLWKLLKPAKPRDARVDAIDREGIERRVESLGDHAAAAREELQELDRRRQQQAIYVALFGRISSGKTSLLRALAGDGSTDGEAIAVTGGSTRRVRHVEGELADGRKLVLADVPGTEEVDDAQHAALARAEADRAHVLLYVCDGEPTRSEDLDLRAVAAFGKPLLLVLNKADRYDDTELAQLRNALAKRYDGVARQVVIASAGHRETLRRVDDGGIESSIERDQPPRVERLITALQTVASQPLDQLEPAREAAVLASVDQRLDAAEQAQRQERSEAAIRRYTRRAMVGAMAAIAPGSDLIIQGALATALARELAGIHGIPVRDVDLDDFLTRAGGLLRTSTSLVLAVAGNALKAFPGFGTLGGGLLHAVAYGLIFHSLGHALAASFADLKRFDRQATLDAFQQGLKRPDPDTVVQLARIARDVLQEDKP